MIMTLKKRVWDENISKCVGKGREKSKESSKAEKA